MVGRKSRRRKLKGVMGSHNRCWLWGRHVVMETLAAGRWPVIELRLSDRLSNAEREAVQSLVGDREIPLISESPDRLARLCRASDHQGYVAKMRPFPYLTVDGLLGSLPPNPILCLLDGIQDPHNYGAILRSADVFGIDGVIVGTDRQSDVTAIVARSSAGAVNHVPLAQAEHLVATAGRLREQGGLELVRADHRAETTCAELDWTGPTMLVIGNEAIGVSDELGNLCDRAVRIPQVGRTESLNAAVAAGILFYEIRRQRRAPSAPEVRHAGS